MDLHFHDNWLSLLAVESSGTTGLQFLIGRQEQ